MTASPKERVEARIRPILPKGYRLLDPEQFDGGWRLTIALETDPIVSMSVWDPDLERAIWMLVDDIEKQRPPQ
jgi:hypothetical protein